MTEMNVTLKEGVLMCVLYKNWRGETQRRLLRFKSAPFWGHDEWHPLNTWLIQAIDTNNTDKGVRNYAVKDMRPA